MIWPSTRRSRFASRNPVLASLLESFSSRTSRARVWRGITQAGAIEQTKTDHRAIYDALRHRRPDLAGGLAIAHIGAVESWFEQTLSESEPVQSVALG